MRVELAMANGNVSARGQWPQNTPQLVATEKQSKAPVNLPSSTVTEKDFKIFLNHWWDELHQALKLGILLIMPPSVCKDLKKALNAHPTQTGPSAETVSEVTSEGNLVLRTDTHERVVNWFDL
jgi:hypothetical protein